ncbi:MAG: acyltransferase [Rhizomicrobium sp.]|jgi:peptidoglycan/LPS O-acetylase OafA/YrhL
MSQSRPAEIRALAGARAFPPLILVLFHFCEGHGYRGAPWFDLPVAKGYLWVEFFFTLSGFVLTYVYASRMSELWRRKGYFDFLKARLARLYPLHIAMLFLILFMVIVLRWIAARGGYVSIYDEPYHPINTWPSFIANLFLVQAWNIFPYLSWNGASWFVSVEFLLCLLFPVYLLMTRRGWLTGLLLVLAGTAALALLAHPRYGLDLTFHDGIWRGMAAFAAGVGMAMLHRDIGRRGIQVSEFVCSLLQVAVIGWLLYGIYETGWSHRPADIYTAMPIMALVFALAFDRGVLARALQTRVPLMLGEWSYAIYIGQTPVLQFLRHAQMHLYPAPTAIVFGRSWAAWEPEWHWLEPALLVVVAVAWGWLLFALIEKPANAALRKLFAHPATRGAASA